MLKEFHTIDWLVVELEEEPVAELDGEPVTELDGGHADLPIAELDGEPVAELDGGHADWPVAELDGEPIAAGYSCTQPVFQILKRDHWLIRTVAYYLVCGTDTPKVSVFVQSHDRAHVELMWMLSSTTPIGWPNRMIHFIEKSRKVGDNNVGVPLLPFPVLMVFDILLYQTDCVSVIEEQHRLLAYLANVLNERS
ncbi:hypothetical protein Nepgr_002462 [Nepenthes gracilis]|uniref:Uncharacterized protein n=1 Tax=Nepenthes gracilis TaxID=150966 RepID=A0AAD3P8U4_NEPGR|nr:hypothetical protein Nepgr_002462 [Nepenthes gracilis]